MKTLILNDYLIIQNYGSSKDDYKIFFVNEKNFYKDIKDVEYAIFNWGDGYNECNIELANMVAGFIKPHLPLYTKLVLDTIYLKYQRQERPTLDCRASQLYNYIKQFDYDKIRVPYLHGINYRDDRLRHNDKIWIFRKKDVIRFEENSFIILPDEGAKILIDKKQYYTPARDFYVDDISKLVACIKERNGEIVNTKIPYFNKEAQEYIIVDDIIAGGISIINVADLIKEQKSNAKIKVYCIFLMSQYGVDKIKEKHPDIEIIAQYDLR